MTSISLLSPQDEENWNDFVLSHPSATIYHTLEWRDATRVFHHQHLYLVAKDNKGAIEGVLPLFYLSGWRGRRLVSVPLRDRGGPLYKDEQVMKELLQATKDLAAEENCKYVEIKSLNLLPEIVEQLNFVKYSYYLTTVIPLDPDVGKIWKALDYGKVRWAIRKAEKSNVKVRWGENFSDVDSFYQIFLQTRKRLGIPPYSVELFKEIWKKMGEKNKASLLLVMYHDRVIGGLLLFHFKDRVIEAYAASDEKYLDLCPNDLLLWKAIVWAATNRYRYFDFGASSPYQRGLRNFKSKWGGYEQEVPFYFFLNSLETIPFLDSNAPNFQMLRKLWSKMPLAFTRTFGPFLTKHMD